MRWILSIICLLFCAGGFAQKEAELIKRSQSFHRALVEKSADLSSFLDDKLSYGHSNGWLENKLEILEHINTGVMVYLEYPEDSVVADMQNNIGYLRFVTTLKASLRGNQATFRLRVLEVWRKEDTNWVLYARQAVRSL